MSEEKQNKKVETNQRGIIYKAMVVFGAMMLFFLLSLLLLRVAPGILKLVGVITGVFSVYVGWAQLSTINKQKQKKNV